MCPHKRLLVLATITSRLKNYEKKLERLKGYDMGTIYLVVYFHIVMYERCTAFGFIKKYKNFKFAFYLKCIFK
jgi:hypothetical protein